MSDMTLGSLAADLKLSLLDAAKMFTAASDADFKRHITVAAEDFSRVRKLRRKGTLTLVAGQAEYDDVPDDFNALSSCLWGIQPLPQKNAWDAGFEPVPRMSATADPDDAAKRVFQFDPPPTANQISYMGAECRFYYYAMYTIHASTSASTTILPSDRNLLLLRAQAEALRELAIRGVAKPVQLRDGLGMGPRNGHPAALYDALRDEFEKRAQT